MVAGVKEVGFFKAASESFVKANINYSIEESLVRYREICKASKERKIPVANYCLHIHKYNHGCDSLLDISKER